MSGGIVAQRGFLFQKYVFINTIINNAAMNVFFTYEGVDDIDITTNDDMSESMFMISSSRNNYIQVKSGKIAKTCWAKVIGNWLLTDNYSESSFTLVSEYELDFKINADETIAFVCDFFEKGASKKEDAIAKKVYKKIFAKSNNDEAKKVIIDLCKKSKIIVKSFDEISHDIKQVFFNIYCSDIKVYEKAKQCRFERIIEYIQTEIDDAIINKKKYTMTFQKLMALITRVQEEISDKKYTIDISVIKKNKEKKAQMLIQQNNIREIKQLELVQNDSKFIMRELIHELLYKDFRDVYEKGVDISNIETLAYENFEDALFELDMVHTAKELYSATTKRTIESSIMPNNQAFRNGCYVFLTGEKIPIEKQITWGEENE